MSCGVAMSGYLSCKITASYAAFFPAPQTLMVGKAATLCWAYVPRNSKSGHQLTQNTWYLEFEFRVTHRAELKRAGRIAVHCPDPCHPARRQLGGGLAQHRLQRRARTAALAWAGPVVSTGDSCVGLVGCPLPPREGFRTAPRSEGGRADRR